MSEDGIVDLCKISPNLVDTPLSRLFVPLSPIYAIADNVIVKVGPPYCLRPCEAAAMQLVRRRTCIPVPAMHRYFVKGDNAYLVMEYVRGELLDHCWDDLSNWEKLRIACVLRNYVKQMRRIRSPQIDEQIPGPLIDDLSAPLKCNLPAFGENPVGPFSSYARLRDWMNGRLRVTQFLMRQRYPGPRFDGSEPLVFTHGDLALRNIIRGDDGKLWLIDFGCAGVYPRWAEVYCMIEGTMYNQPKLWTFTRKFAAGSYAEQEAYTQYCQPAMMEGGLMADPGEIEDWDGSRAP